jgi:hypothetical protein
MRAFLGSKTDPGRVGEGYEEVLERKMLVVENQKKANERVCEITNHLHPAEFWLYLYSVGGLDSGKIWI